MKRTLILFLLLMIPLMSPVFSEDIKTKKLGNTGKKVGVVSLDAKNTAQCEWRAFSNCLSSGTNLILTSPREEGSEAFVGENLGPNGKRNTLIGTKWKADRNASESDFLASFQHSLKKLNTNYIDCIVIDEVEEMAELRNNYPIQAFKSLKKAGKTQYLGIYIKDITKSDVKQMAEYAVSKSEFDFIILDFNVSNFKKMRPIVEFVGRSGMGVVAINAIEESQKYPNLAKRILGKRSGDIETATIKWIADEKWITTILVSPKNTDEAGKILAGAVEDDD